MKQFKRLLLIAYPYMRNKFWLTGLLFVMWLGFIDDNNIITQVKGRITLAQVERERQFYLQETQQSFEELKLLQNDREMLEKFAREKYLMKKPDEDIFIFTAEDEN